MRFHTVLLLMLFLGLISLTLNDYVFYIQKLDVKVNQSRELYISKKFIAESFRNTCKGKGFENLEEWQLTCRAIFKLDYIGWCRAQEFMIDDNEAQGLLMYGKWLGKDGLEQSSGEVYCRTERSCF